MDPDWRHAKKILCVRLDNLGDVLMTTPAIRAMRESMPLARISLMTSPAAAPAARLIPEIDEVLVYDAPWMKATTQRENGQQDLAWIDHLKACQFDAAVIFTVFSQSPLPAALACFLADIPLRLAHCRENPYQLLTHWVHETEIAGPTRHEVERQLALVASVGCVTENTRLSLAVHESDRMTAMEKLTRTGLDLLHPWIVIHPGASAPSRRYDPASYGWVARRMMADGRQVVLTGSRDEAQLLNQISTDAPGVITLPGELSLGELAATIEMAPLLIANNTGPVHIAAAVGTPVVVLYAQTNPQHTPWQVSNRVLFHDVPCKYCYRSVCPMLHHDCLRLVRPEDVIESAKDLLAETWHIPKNTGAAA